VHRRYQPRRLNGTKRTTVEPFSALYDLDELTDQLRGLEHRITEKVQLARCGGASWAQIGRAVRLSKQRTQQSGAAQADGWA
jgi:hypothetical protein